MCDLMDVRQESAAKLAALNAKRFAPHGPTGRAARDVALKDAAARSVQQQPANHHGLHPGAAFHPSNPNYHGPEEQPNVRNGVSPPTRRTTLTPFYSKFTTVSPTFDKLLAGAHLPLTTHEPEIHRVDPESGSTGRLL
jgi:hypothetical protein